MKQTWKLNFEIRAQDGEQRGSCEVKAWTPGEAVRMLSDFLKKTAKDDRAKLIKSITISLSQKGD